MSGLREEQVVIDAAPQVSVGMPVYNGEKYLRDALDAWLAQTFCDFEMLISDNASTDGTAAICEAYAARDRRIRYVRHAQNGGVNANFDFVRDNTSAPLFVWAAVDDRHAATFLEEAVRIHRYDPGCGLVFSDFTVANFATGEKTTFTVVPSNTNIRYLNYLIRLNRMTSNIIYGVYKREALDGLVLRMMDLMDVYVTLHVGCRYRVRIANANLFTSGVKSAQRAVTTVSGRKMRLWPFLCMQFHLARREFGLLRAVCAFPVALISLRQYFNPFYKAKTQSFDA